MGNPEPLAKPKLELLGLTGAEGRDAGHDCPQARELYPTESDQESLVGTGKYVPHAVYPGLHGRRALTARRAKGTESWGSVSSVSPGGGLCQRREISRQNRSRAADMERMRAPHYQ